MCIRDRRGPIAGMSAPGGSDECRGGEGPERGGQGGGARKARRREETGHEKSCYEKTGRKKRRCSGGRGRPRWPAGDAESPGEKQTRREKSCREQSCCS